MTHFKKMQLVSFVSLFAFAGLASGQQNAGMKPEETEIWTPVPAVVTPGATDAAPPSDAIVLFDGKNLDQWVNAQTGAPAEWIVGDGILTVKKAPGIGNIQTKRTFKNYQLHVEWRIPENITGSGQARGNSGVFLASTGPNDDGYELQVLDSYNNSTYVNGQAGAIYKENPPLVNPNRKPGEWQTYNIVWTAPTFNEDGSLKTPAFVTAFLNGVLVQNHFQLIGQSLVHRQAVLQKVRSRADQVAGARRQKRTDQLQEHLGTGTAVVANASGLIWNNFTSKSFAVLFRGRRMFFALLAINRRKLRLI